MRYIIKQSKRHEYSERLKYLYDTFSLYFVSRGSVDGFDVFESFPFVQDNILIIYGHNRIISKFLNKHIDDISENYIAIISCGEYENGDYRLKGKNVYLAPQRPYYNNKKCAPLFKGSEYGFGFDLTEAEIKLYTCRKKDILEKIKYVFRRIY